MGYSLVGNIAIYVYNYSFCIVKANKQSMFVFMTVTKLLFTNISKCNNIDYTIQKLGVSIYRK